MKQLAKEGIEYRPSVPRFCRTSVHNMLTDRAYIGEVRYRGQWYPGKQTPIIDRPMWDRVQTLPGGHGTTSHTLTYASDFIQCGHCGYSISGEQITKKKSGRVYNDDRVLSTTSRGIRERE